MTTGNTGSSTNGSTTIRATTLLKSDFCVLPQMNTLKENIINSKNKIATFDDEIRNIKADITTQQQVAQQAKADNDMKLNFNNSIQLLRETDFSKVISVVITQQEFNEAIAKLLELQTKLNGTNIDAAEQQRKLEESQAKLAAKQAEHQTETDLLTSYRLQLKVSIDRQRQELAELEALLDNTEQQQQPAGN